jgi:hypothetical protein
MILVTMITLEKIKTWWNKRSNQRLEIPSTELSIIDAVLIATNGSHLYRDSEMCV